MMTNDVFATLSKTYTTVLVTIPGKSKSDHSDTVGLLLRLWAMAGWVFACTWLSSLLLFTYSVKMSSLRRLKSRGTSNTGPPAKKWGLGALPLPVPTTRSVAQHLCTSSTECKKYHLTVRIADSWTLGVLYLLSSTDNNQLLFIMLLISIVCE